jgi:uncharacterized RDD family membrane protein YckC
MLLRRLGILRLGKGFVTTKPEDEAENERSTKSVAHPFLILVLCISILFLTVVLGLVVFIFCRELGLLFMCLISLFFVLIPHDKK